MAGKTFRGVGDEEDPSLRRPQDDAPRLIDEDEDSRGVYSGPTVVDDEKVAEVLKKLRSLDQPPGPLTGVTQAVVDTNETAKVLIDASKAQVESAPVLEPAAKPAAKNVPGPGALAVPGAAPIKTDAGPARLEDIMYPLARPTAIGRSASTPGDAPPVTISSDPARGTMFGRSIHLPDVNSPDAAEVELSSGAVHVDGSPPTSPPFPLAEAPAKPAKAAAPVAPAVVIPPLAAPVGPPVQRFHTPYDPADTTLVGSKHKKVLRALAVLGGLAIAAGGWFAWTQLRGTPDAPATTAGAAPAAQPHAPSIEPLPVKTPPAPTPSGVPAPEPVPTPRAAAPPAPTPPAATAAPKPAVEEPASVPSAAAATHRTPPTPERRPAARMVAPADPAAASAPSKPSRSRRRSVISEDPDATLPPSL